MIKKWKTLSSKFRGDYRIFKSYAVERENYSGDKKGEFFLIKSPDWMTVVPVVNNEHGVECFLMVKQYRHGCDSVTLEFPAGMVDPGEDSLKTASRELSEETGYQAKTIIKVGEVSPNTAFMTNRTSTYVARGLVKVSEQSLDEHEEIETLLVPVTEFDSMVGGEMVNSAIMVQAYYFYLKSLEV